jgi:tetratricopeptide (TPR) repeat protein
LDIASVLTEARRCHGGGDLARAAALYAQVLAAAPGQPDALHLSGVLALQQQRFLDAERQLAAAVAAQPGNPDFHSNLGVALRALGREADAADAFARALALDPAHANAGYNLAIAQRNLGQLDAAIASMRDAVAREPGSAERHGDLAGLLMEAGRFEEALGACDACLDRAPGNVLAISYKLHALEQCGDRAGAAALKALDRVIRPTSLPLPPGWSDVRALCAELAAYVSGHPSLARPQDRATTHGRQTGRLLTDGDAHARALRWIIDTAVAEYLAALPVDAGHPWLARRPPRWSLSAWGVVLEDQGYQAPHIHPPGWVSGVFYVALPCVIGPDDAGQAGWIEFGRAPEEIPSPRPPEVRTFMPEVGLMVLFPSYLHHRTIPFRAGEPRVSIAFDALPVWA